MKLLLVGCGNMLGAMLHRWVGHSSISHIDVITLTGKRECEYEPHPTLHFTTNWAEISDDYDMAIVGVKPQSLPETLPVLKPHLKGQTLVVSIAAGTKMSYFEDVLGDHPVVRTMPNLPSKIGMGLTSMVASEKVSDRQRQQVERLFDVLGDVIWTDDETKMDALTAIAGSGPGFVFLIMDYFYHAATDLGVEPDMAKQMVIQTFKGSAQFAAKNNDNSLESLREAVTSKGGMTAEGIKVLQEDGLIEQIVQRALLATDKRGQELAEELERKNKAALA